MEFFKIKHDIPFMSYGRLTSLISLATFLLAVFFLIVKGLHYSVEFTGGTVLEVRSQQIADLHKIREQIDSLQYGEFQVQTVGNSKDILIRLPVVSGKTSAQLSE